tara:strand:- start:1051 stop:1632 length:582 start_codon:yes stop_codon:yes gene_type:complete
MEGISEQEWTDGAGSALQKAGNALKKAERERHDADEDYYSNPRILVMDLDSGASMILRTSRDGNAKTKGYGYRRCPAVTQRITAKLPTKKIIARLARMAIRSFVPTNAPPEQISVVVKSAIEDIASQIANDDEWSAEDDKYGVAVTKAVNELMGHTWTTRAGDSLVSMEAIPVPMAELDVEAMNEWMDEAVVE